MTAFPSQNDLAHASDPTIPSTATYKTAIRALWSAITGLLGTDGTAATARETLGVKIGTDVQAYHANLAALTTSASQAEMEAGTEASLRAMSPLRVAQAIAALGSAGTDQVARDQIAITNLRLLLNTAVATGALVQGKQWELATDEWGATSTSETHVAPGSLGYYTNASSVYAVTAGMLSASGLPSFSAANFVDGNTGTLGYTPDAAGVDAWLQVDLGVGVAVAMEKVRLYVTGECGAIWDVEYSDDAVSWSKAATGFNVSGGAGWKQITWDASVKGAHRYWRILKMNAGSGGYYHSEIEWTKAAGNITLIPDAAVSVSTAPTYMDCYCLYKDDSGSAVLGTDLTVELSRDGGTTWTTATLTNLASFDGTYSIIKARASVASQPSGTSMLCRIKTLNNKAQRVAAPALYAE